MNPAYEMVLVAILAGAGADVAGPAHMSQADVQAVLLMPYEFRHYAVRRCQEMGVAEFGEKPDFDDSWCVVGYLNLMRCRYQGRFCPGDPRFPDLKIPDPPRGN